MTERLRGAVSETIASRRGTWTDPSRYEIDGQPSSGRAAGASGMEQRRHTLLVVDDEVDVLESLRHQFHRGYRVLTRPPASRPSRSSRKTTSS